MSLGWIAESKSDRIRRIRGAKAAGIRRASPRSKNANSPLCTMSIGHCNTIHGVLQCPWIAQPVAGSRRDVIWTSRATRFLFPTPTFLFPRSVVDVPSPFRSKGAVSRPYSSFPVRRFGWKRVQRSSCRGSSPGRFPAGRLRSAIAASDHAGGWRVTRQGRNVSEGAARGRLVHLARLGRTRCQRQTAPSGTRRDRQLRPVVIAGFRGPVLPAEAANFIRHGHGTAPPSDSASGRRALDPWLPNRESTGSSS